MKGSQTAFPSSFILPPSSLLSAPGEVDREPREDDEEADAGGLRGEVDEVEREERGQKDVEGRNEGVAGRAVGSRLARRLAPHDQNGADHQSVEDEVGGDDVFEQLR